jgi:hypothetical protein
MRDVTGGGWFLWVPRGPAAVRIAGLRRSRGCGGWGSGVAIPAFLHASPQPQTGVLAATVRTTAPRNTSLCRTFSYGLRPLTSSWDIRGSGLEYRLEAWLEAGPWALRGWSVGERDPAQPSLPVHALPLPLAFLPSALGSCPTGSACCTSWGPQLVERCLPMLPPSSNRHEAASASANSFQTVDCSSGSSCEIASRSSS